MFPKNWFIFSNLSFQKHIFATDVEDLRHLKLWTMLDKKVKAWNMKGWHHKVSKITGLENSSLRQVFSPNLSTFIGLSLVKPPKNWPMTETFFSALIWTIFVYSNECSHAFVDTTQILGLLDLSNCTKKIWSFYVFPWPNIG